MQFGLQQQLQQSAVTDLSQLAVLLAEGLAVSPPRLFAISGAQGSGKSTLAAALRQVLGGFGIHAAVVSLDDYYLSKTRRRQLAIDVHPLLALRGVPGTHQIARLSDDLQAQQQGLALQLPRFDKASDDTLPALPPSRYDVLIVEGWCLGALPQTPAQLQQTVNLLDLQPGAARWRQYQNEQLTQTYAPLWPLLQPMLFLQAPDWPTVCAWRQQQEQQLWSERDRGMTDAELQQFMLPFQRWTQAMLGGQHTPQQYQVRLAADRRVLGIQCGALSAK